MTPNRLTALIPAYNEAYMLRLCLQSILPFFDEIIVLDDASTDGTWEVAGDTLSGHPRHELIRNLQPAGWIESRNRLCAATSSNWLFFLDADDVLTEYNAHLLEQIATGDQPVVRLHLCELWGDFRHTTGRLRHYDRCHTFVNRAVIGDLAWKGGSAATPYGNGHGGWRAAAGPGPLLFHCKGVKPDRRLVERSVIRAWMRAGKPGRLEDWAHLHELSDAHIHRAALHILLHSKQDRIRELPVNAPRLPAVLRNAPQRFQMVYSGGQIMDRVDHQEALHA